MTVSPSWPLDGNLQPQAGDTGVEGKDHSPHAGPPPTLFRLPNLSASSRIRRKAEEAEDPRTNLVPPGDVSHTTPATIVEPQAGLKRSEVVGRPVEFIEEIVPPSAADQLSAADQPSTAEHRRSTRIDGAFCEPAVASIEEFVSPPLAAAPTSAPGPSQPTPVRDAPAGRSWMESLGSHGVVIVLLLVVVAAALLTGQGDEDPASKSLSTQSELLDFDELNIELPATDAPISQGGVLAESQASAANQAVASPTSQSYTEVPLPTSNVVFEVPAATAQGSEPVTSEFSDGPPNSSEAVATLDSPLPRAIPGLDHELNEGLLSSEIQTNRFVNPGTGVSALPVSVRSQAQPQNSSLPSLEELAGVSVQAADVAPGNSTAPTRLLSETPAGISDWSKYLPDFESAAVPDAGTSSSAYQVFQP